MLTAKTRSFNPNIHGFRGFAALSVFLFHIYDMARKQGLIAEDIYFPLKAAIVSLSSGVDLFFMISGYLITASLIQHANVPRFLLDRVIRIYPVFLFLHVILFIVSPFLHYKWMDGISFGDWSWNFFTNLFFLPGVFDLPLLQLNAWSLSYEFTFYLFSAAAYLLCLRRRSAGWLWLLLAPVFIFFYPRALFFTVGVAVYFLLKKKPDWLASRHWRIGWLCVLPFFAIVGCAYATDQTRFGWLALLPGFFVFLDIVKGVPVFARFLRHKIMQFFGTISYSFYLWHPVVTYPLKLIAAKILVGRFGVEPMLAVALFGILSFAIVLPLSYVSYLLLEQKVGRWLKSVTSSGKRTNAA